MGCGPEAGIYTLSDVPDDEDVSYVRAATISTSSDDETSIPTTPSVRPTSTLDQGGITTITSTLSPLETNNSDGDKDSSAPVGAIVGGVIGGVAVIGIIVLGVIWLLRRNKNDGTITMPQPVGGSNNRETYQNHIVGPSGATMSQHTPAYGQTSQSLMPPSTTPGGTWNPQNPNDPYYAATVSATGLGIRSGEQQSPGYGGQGGNPYQSGRAQSWQGGGEQAECGQGIKSPAKQNEVSELP